MKWTHQCTTILVLLALCLPSCSRVGPAVRSISENDAIVKIEVLSCRDSVLNPRSPGCEDIKYGFEGGRVVKVGGTYHLITSEMVGDQLWVNMRTG